MKKIVTLAVAMAALIAWMDASQAASKKRNVAKKPPVVTAQQFAPAAQQFSPMPRTPAYYTRQRSPNPAWDVYFPDGRYAGSDPDPAIRSMLLRDDPAGNSNN